MALWNRIRAALGLRRSSGEVAFEGDRIVLREIERARAIPQEPGEAGPKDVSRCPRCDVPVRRMVFTTAGAGDQMEIWRAYPLAIDGWLCANCGWSAMPRFITVDESTEFGRRGAEHASNGELDDAEFWFRRILASWPGYPAGYADMGQVSLARAEAAASHEEKAGHRAAAESWLRQAVDADREQKLAGIRIPFARVLALNGKEAEALAILDSLLAQVDVAAPIRSDAETVAASVREGRALFQRGTELGRGIMLERPTEPLTPSDRQRLVLALSLLQQSEERKATFATTFFIGKVAFRLSRFGEACAALERANAIDPDQPDGCRELSNVYLELERAADAMPHARRAAALRPEEAGLRCNVAVVCLLTGEVAAARAEASAALALDPADGITRNLLAVIEDVAAGRRAPPRSLAQLEGRAR